METPSVSDQPVSARWLTRRFDRFNPLPHFQWPWDKDGNIPSKRDLVWRGHTRFLCRANTPSDFIRQLPSVWDLNVPMQWLIQGLVPEAAVTLLTGESGCGKSTFALALSAAVASGSHFLGHPTTQREVLIVDRENGPWVYKERAARLRFPESQDVHVWGVWNERQPEGPDSSDIIDFAKQADHPLIVFDSLIAFHPKSEQDSSETRKYMQHFRSLAALGASVLLIHHTGKGETSRLYRGSSDIRASVDVAYLLKTDTPMNIESSTLTPFKTREGKTERLRIKYDDGQFISLGDGNREAVLDIIQKNPQINQREIITRAGPSGVSKKAVLTILEAEVKEGGCLSVVKGDKNSMHYSLKKAP